MHAYDNMLIYKERIKIYHNQKLVRINFNQDNKLFDLIPC